jgi:FMN phosphatase YigB (HAD superfamily)
MVKLLIFDAGDILYTFPWQTWLRITDAFFKKHNIDSRLQAKKWKQIEPLVTTGALGLREAHKFVFKELGASERVGRAWTALDNWIVRNFCKRKPGVKRTLLALKKAGYKLAVLSDSVHGRRTKWLIFKRIGLEGVFDAVFCSCDIGHVKPSPAAYRLVMRHFGAKPAETVFIGHSRDELDGASAIGIRTIAVDREKGARADYYARKFSDIPAILRLF